MKRVRLKENSPEFIDDSRDKKNPRQCDIDGCTHVGEFRAPKDRSLKSYYYFCLNHVTDYNRAWNFFDGMNDTDIQDHIYSSLFGDRPTWRYASFGDLEEKLRHHAFGFRHHYRDEDPQRLRDHVIPADTPEGEAMKIMGLVPPVDLGRIKEKYKQLAKKYHPDCNPDNPEAEEMLKDINMAYTVLRLAYQKFENIESQATV